MLHMHNTKAILHTEAILHRASLYTQSVRSSVILYRDDVQVLSPGTCIVVPSRILSRPCCTPSPPTSLRWWKPGTQLILSTSSKNTIPGVRGCFTHVYTCTLVSTPISSHSRHTYMYIVAVCACICALTSLCFVHIEIGFLNQKEEGKTRHCHSNYMYVSIKQHFNMP